MTTPGPRNSDVLQMDDKLQVEWGADQDPINHTYVWRKEFMEYTYFYSLKMYVFKMCKLTANCQLCLCVCVWVSAMQMSCKVCNESLISILRIRHGEQREKCANCKCLKWKWDNLR